MVSQWCALVVIIIATMLIGQLSATCKESYEFYKSSPLGEFRVESIEDDLREAFSLTILSLKDAERGHNELKFQDDKGLNVAYYTIDQLTDGEYSARYIDYISMSTVSRSLEPRFTWNFSGSHTEFYPKNLYGSLINFYSEYPEFTITDTDENILAKISDLPSYNLNYLRKCKSDAVDQGIITIRNRKIRQPGCIIS